MTAYASLAQDIHRQRFRQALAWRKGLSKRARIFLESYCLGKHPFGCDPLVTQWHKYALSIYLKRVNFEVVSLPAQGKPGLLHVKHPALLAVIQKHGGIILTKRENLSSLEEGYLVEQVGLDTQLGDIIEAITLPGLIYRYLV